MLRIRFPVTIFRITFHSALIFTPMKKSVVYDFILVSIFNINIAISKEYSVLLGFYRNSNTVDRPYILDLKSVIKSSQIR